MPDVPLGRQRPIGDGRHVLEQDRRPIVPPTTRSPTARVFYERPRFRLMARFPWITSPIGSPRLADCSAMRRSATVSPAVRKRRIEFNDDATLRPADRHDFARSLDPLEILSIECATRSRSVPAVAASFEYRVNATIGTSSMPFGLMIGGRPGSPAASRRWSARCRTSAPALPSVRSRPRTAPSRSPRQAAIPTSTCSTLAICDNVLPHEIVENDPAIVGRNNINRKDFALGSMTVEKAMQSGLPGLRVVNKGGIPGEGANMQIRGLKTIIGDGNPLVVINGVPFMPDKNESKVIGGLSRSVFRGS